MLPTQRDQDASGLAGSREDGGIDKAKGSASTAAQRALAEAAARRLQASAESPPPEIGGRNGPEPVRYGDWEVKGLASDF